MNKKIDVDLIRSMLLTKTIGGQLVYFDVVESTMETIRELAESNAKEGAVVVAGFILNDTPSTALTAPS